MAIIADQSIVVGRAVDIVDVVQRVVTTVRVSRSSAGQVHIHASRRVRVAIFIVEVVPVRITRLIVSHATIHGVVARTRIKVIITTTAVELVVAIVAVQIIGPVRSQVLAVDRARVATVELVVARSTAESVAFVATEEQVITVVAEKQVVTALAAQLIIAFTAFNSVVAEACNDQVGALRCNDVIVTAEGNYHVSKLGTV